MRKKHIAQMLGNWSVATGQLPHRTHSPGPYILNYIFDIDSAYHASAMSKTKGHSKGREPGGKQDQNTTAPPLQAESGANYYVESKCFYIEWISNLH